MNKKIVALVIGVLVLVGGGAGAYYLTQNNTASNNQSQTAKTSEEKATWIDNVLTYKGQDGKTALELLEQSATIVKSGEGEMAYITSINNLAANPSNEYWSFNVNGTPASVGAGSYVTKSTDTITWKISTF